MAQNSVTPIQVQASTVPLVTPPATPTAEERALDRSVSAAVQTVNDSGYPGAGREVTFSVDQATKRPVIQVIDTLTKEVVQQWPPEYLIQIATDARKSTGDSG
jgi:flagellar protein FlaG